MSIQSNLQHIRKAIEDTAKACGRNPADITLLAVSKRHNAASIQQAIDAGQSQFGENYIQEAQEKCKQFKDVSFHFIGHVQSNKAKLAAELFDMVETVDRLKLAKALHRHSETLGKKLDILIQVNIGKDSNKHGVYPEEVKALLEAIQPLSGLRPKGLMTMPPLTADLDKTRSYFRALRELSEQCAERNLFYDNADVKLSMGMSNDFGIAIEEGSTSIRVGTAIFGERPIAAN